MKAKGLFRLQKNFFVLDLKKQKVVWEIPASERVFFLGKDAALLDEIVFKERKIKNLT